MHGLNTIMKINRRGTVGMRSDIVISEEIQRRVNPMKSAMDFAEARLMARANRRAT